MATIKDLSLYILNEKNKLITKDFINNLLSKYNVNIVIKNLNIFQIAMTHESYLKRDMRSEKNEKLIKTIKEKDIQPLEKNMIVIPLQMESYERLEFLGDSVIHCILAEYLYIRYADKDQGFLTKLRTKIENGQSLAKLARELLLNEYVLLARNIEQTGGRDKNIHIFEDTFESFVGALYVDTGYRFDICKTFVISVVEAHIDTAQIIHRETNHKDTLLQYYHKMKWTDPEYKTLEIIEKNGKKYFNMCVSGPNNTIVGYGSGYSKKCGEQKAALQALVHFQLINDDDSDEEIYDEFNLSDDSEYEEVKY